MSLSHYLLFHQLALLFLFSMLLLHSLAKLTFLHSLILAANALATLWTILIIFILQQQEYVEGKWLHVSVCVCNLIGNMLNHADETTSVVPDDI